MAAVAAADRLRGSAGEAELLIRVDGPMLDVARGDGQADLAFATGRRSDGSSRAISCRRRPIDSGAVEVLRGRRDLLGRFTRTFHLAA